MLRKLLRTARLGEDCVRRTLHLKESSETREREAQKFWTRPPEESNSSWWHHRGASAYNDDQWLSIGKNHAQLYTSMSGREILGKIAEWGAGGGANAVAFAKNSSEFYGIEVSAPSLDECEKQLHAESCPAAFRRVLIEIPAPEQAIQQIGENNLDLLVSFYVFELLPSSQYCKRVLEATLKMLRPGGQAFIQIKYQTDDWRTRRREWAYSRGAANMTTFRIDEFWSLAAEVGFKPRSVHLVPKPAEVSDERYAYFLLEKSID